MILLSRTVMRLFYATFLAILHIRIYADEEEKKETPAQQAKTKY